MGRPWIRRGVFAVLRMSTVISGRRPSRSSRERSLNADGSERVARILRTPRRGGAGSRASPRCRRGPQQTPLQSVRRRKRHVVVEPELQVSRRRTSAAEPAAPKASRRLDDHLPNEWKSGRTHGRVGCRRVGRKLGTCEDVVVTFLCRAPHPSAALLSRTCRAPQCRVGTLDGFESLRLSVIRRIGVIPRWPSTDAAADEAEEPPRR